MGLEQFRELPLEEVAFLQSLRTGDWVHYRARIVELHELGYTYAAIGSAVGVSRQRVHQIVQGANGNPRVRQVVDASNRRPVPPAAVELLTWAWEASSNRRGPVPPGWSLPTAAHRSLVDTVTQLIGDGFTFAQLAEVLGVGEGAMRGRMLRAGVTKHKVRQKRAGENVA